jgi:CMP/dCMP kinase
LKKLIIAIDGTAGSGKSTTARLVARRLNYLHIDTGAMYRAATYAVLNENIDPDNKVAVENLVVGLKIRLHQSNGIEVMLNGKQVTDKIRSNEVTAHVSKISSYERVRAKMVEEQRAMGKTGGVVLEGRDIGTIVFPNADIKFFFVADIEERTRRRRREMSEQGEEVSFESMLNDIKARDYHDSTRAVSPLKKADDAITIDTSNLSIEEQVQKVISIVEKKHKINLSVSE